MHSHAHALRNGGVRNRGGRGDRGVGDRRLGGDVDRGVGNRWGEELTGDQSSAAKKGERKQNDNYPPEENPTHHGSDPFRPCSPDSLYLDAARFAALWPGIELRLHRRLVRDGLDSDAARDLCQDVASAFLRAPQRFRSREELVETALLAGFRLSQKLRQREAREQIGEVPEAVVPDVADEVEQRHLLEAVTAAIDALACRDRRALLGNSSPGALSPGERNLGYVRLHRARRRLREQLRGWLAGVYVGKFLPLRDDIVAEGALRVVYFSATALLVVGTSILQDNTTPPAAAAHSTAVGIERFSASSVAGIGRTGQAVTPPASPLPASVTRDRRGASNAGSGPGPEGSSRSLSVISTPVGTRADAGVNSRPAGNDSLMCLSGLRVAPDLCVHHPLRKEG